MFYKLIPGQEEQLKNMPETGMGYQIIEARRFSEYQRREFIILNSTLVIEDNQDKRRNLNEIKNL